MRRANVRPTCIATQFCAVTGEIRHLAVPTALDPRIERRACRRLAQLGHAGQIEPQPVRLRLEALGQRPARVAVEGVTQGCRPTQRANAITSSTGGIAASSP